MSAALTILAGDVRGTRNRLLRRRRGWLALGLAALWLLVALGSVFGLGAALGHLRAAVGLAAVTNILAGSFTWLGVFMLLVGFSTVVSSFYADRDLLLLAAAPLSPAPVFAARLVRAGWASALVASMLVAGLAGYAAGSGLGAAFVLAGVLLVAAEVVAVTALQVLLLAGVVRLAPPARVRDAANLVAAMAGTVFYIGWLVVRSEGGGGRSVAAGVTAVYGVGQNTGSFPTAWPARALAGWGTAGGDAWLLATLALAAALVGAAFLVFRGTYPSGLTAFLETGPRRRRGAVRAAARGGLVPAIVRKDWLTIRRDGRRLVRMLPGAVLAFAYPLLLFRSPGVTGVWLVAFIPWFLAQVFGLSAIATEGRALMLLRLASVSPARVLWAKTVAVLVPVAALSVASAALTAASSGNAGGEALLLPAALWLSAGFSVIAVSAGAIAPRLDVDDPRRAVGFTSVITALVAAAAFGLLSLAALGAAYVASGAPIDPELGRRAFTLLGPDLRLVAAVAAVVLGAVALTPAAGSALLGARALARREL